MKKFYAVTISRMRNGAHYNFMHLFLTLLKEQTSENAEFNKRKENIEAVLKEENRNLLIAQGKYLHATATRGGRIAQPTVCQHQPSGNWPR